MKKLVAIAFLASASCSRATATLPIVAEREPSHADASTDTAGILAEDGGTAGAESPIRPPDPARTVVLPNTTPTDRETGFTLAMDIAAGQLPSARHPLGTVYAAQPGEKPPYPLTITEWDLALGTALRKRVVSADGGVPGAAPGGWNAMIVGTGGRLHLVAYRWNEDLYYLELDSSLEVVTRERLGTVTVSGPSALVSDGSLTVFLAGMAIEKHPRPATGPISDDGYYAATYDSRGYRIAKRFIVPFEDETHDSGGFTDNAAIVHGRIYVLEAEGFGARIVVLGPSLTQIAHRTITTDCDYQRATLRAEGDHVLVDTGDQRLEVSLDLSSVRVVPKGPLVGNKALSNPDGCGRRFAMGPVRVKLCWCGNAPCIAWE